MPPTLDLSRTAHGKAIISTPRINLRRAASYNNNDRGPLSSTSSRFNFNHLVFSPPPSPGLPSLSPPVKKPKRKLLGTIRPLRLLRYAIRLLSVVLVFYVSLVVLTWFFGEPAETPMAPSAPLEPQGLPKVAEHTETVEMVSQKEAPDFPTPIVVTDHQGRAKWTVSIPPGSKFPLSMSQYADICAKCRQVAARAQQLRSQGLGLQVSLGFGSDSTDHDFIDVQEAEKAGYLRGGNPAGEAESEKPVCKTSLTYVLESKDAGLGKTLMMLWMAYGIAQKEGRAFFIDDTRWAYGKFTSIFQPPSLPACSPPPTHEILPCPRHARHLLASSTTMDVLFGSFTQTVGPPSESHDRALQKTQFALARRGYEALFRLNKDDSNFVDDRVHELMVNKIIPKTKGQRSGLAVGVHVRRGDRHPLEFQYRHSYMPLNLYSDAARDIIQARLNHTRGGLLSLGSSSVSGEEAAAAMAHSIVVLASDDPVVYESAEMKGARRAQERIKLASKQTIQKANPKKSVMHKFVDETFGWEGGFFAAMFWNLGVSKAYAADGGGAADGGDGIEPAKPSPETRRLRSLVGRAYMMDLAVLAEASDVVVCTVSAVGCRLLAVMMGWESAMEEGNWVNIEGGNGWLGVDW